MGSLYNKHKSTPYVESPPADMNDFSADGGALGCDAEQN